MFLENLKQLLAADMAAGGQGVSPRPHSANAVANSVEDIFADLIDQRHFRVQPGTDHLVYGRHVRRYQLLEVFQKCLLSRFVLPPH